MPKLAANFKSVQSDLSAEIRSTDNGFQAGLPGKLIFGLPGEDGGYYLVDAAQIDANTLRLTFTPSKDGMPFVDPKDITLPDVPEEQIVKAVTEYLQKNPPSAGVNFETDHTLTLKDGILSVNTTDQMEQDNTLPITSAGVYATVGNIEALLKTI